MVTISYHGKRIKAIPIGRRAGGLWLMRTATKTGRMLEGTRIIVRENSILEGTLPTTERMEEK